MQLSALKKAVTAVFLASLAVSLTPVIANADFVSGDSKGFSTPTGEQRYIVQYKDNVNAEAQSQSLTQKGMEVKDTLTHSINASVVMATPSEAENLKKSDQVTTVEVDHPVSIAGATSIWGLDRVDQRTGRDGQYNIGDEGAGVNVYVVDTGLYVSHTEFTGRVPTGWSGINDGGGVNDCNGHGTHVSGTIAGTTYGVAKKANIIPVRVLECDGTGWSSTVISGMDWAISHHTAGQPAVMNMSIGGFTSASLDQAVRNVINDGITVVAAAGNSNVDACTSAPASVTPAITVAATDINDTQASFSNYGSCVDVQAPGVAIRSAYNNAPTGYNTMSGTSMAAPHVSGAAAVLLSRNRSLTPADVQQTIINNATIGVINGNKGATPNRLLFIPAADIPYSCSNLKLGDAWAGVGLTCNLQSSTQGQVTALQSTGNTSGIASSAEVNIPSVTESHEPVAENVSPTLPVPVATPPAASLSRDTSSQLEQSAGSILSQSTVPPVIDTAMRDTSEEEFSHASSSIVSPSVVTPSIQATGKEINSAEPSKMSKDVRGNPYALISMVSFAVAGLVLLLSIFLLMRCRWNFRS